MSNQLLPCPFCGGDAGENQHTDDCYFTARQAVIDAEKGDVSGVPEMLKAWNRRAIQPAAGEPVAKPDSSDTFYAGLYHKSSPMWHQLHELAVTKGYDHVRYAIECAPVYKCDCRGARKVGLDLEGRTMPCECVEAANDAPPAAAHGDEAVRKDAERYRWLKDWLDDSPQSIYLLPSNEGDLMDEAIDAAMRAQGDGG